MWIHIYQGHGQSANMTMLRANNHMDNIGERIDRGIQEDSYGGEQPMMETKWAWGKKRWKRKQLK